MIIIYVCFSNDFVTHKAPEPSEEWWVTKRISHVSDLGLKTLMAHGTKAVHQALTNITLPQAELLDGHMSRLFLLFTLQLIMI